MTLNITLNESKNAFNNDSSVEEYEYDYDDYYDYIESGSNFKSNVSQNFQGFREESLVKTFLRNPKFEFYFGWFLLAWSLLTPTEEN